MTDSARPPRTWEDIPPRVVAGTAPTTDHIAHAPSSSSVATPAPTCPLCTEEIKYADKVKVLACGDIFHADCLNRWLEASLHCPRCEVQVLFPFAHVAPKGADAAATTTATTTTTTVDRRSLPTVHGPPIPPLAAQGTDIGDLRGICRDCQAVFDRDPRTVRPSTNAWFRCPRCRRLDALDLLRASCSIL